MSNLPKLAIKLHYGNRWKARVNIPNLMERRTLEDVRTFARMYCAKCSLWDSDNIAAIRSVLDWFPGAIAQANADWEKASQDYVHGYRTPLPGRSKAALERTKNNRSLTAAVKTARRRVDRLRKSQTAFIEECKRLKLPVF